MKARKVNPSSTTFRYVLPALATLLLLGGCSQSRITAARHVAVPSHAMPDVDSALSASDSLGSEIFANVQPELSQAEMVLSMATTENPDLKLHSFYPPEVRMARVPTQVIVSGEALPLALETTTSETEIADGIN